MAEPGWGQAEQLWQLLIRSRSLRRKRATTEQSQQGSNKYGKHSGEVFLELGVLSRMPCLDSLLKITSGSAWSLAFLVEKLQN